MTAESAISRFRRDVTLGSALKVALVAAALLGGLALRGTEATVFVVVVAGVWLALSFRSAKGSRLAAESPSLIAAGQYDEAERQIDEALRSFSLFRTVKLLSLHHLAMLRHAQRRWGETALLCRALLRQRLGAGLQGLSKPARLMLAEALLEMGDTAGARDAIGGLYSQRLSLAESLKLLRLHLDYLTRIGAWDQIIPPAPPDAPGAPPGPGGWAWRTLVTRVQLAELMPAADSAQAQAFMALAAKKVGRPDWSDWLRRRAELLADVGTLAAERPALWELWKASPES